MKRTLWVVLAALISTTVIAEMKQGHNMDDGHFAMHHPGQTEAAVPNMEENRELVQFPRNEYLLTLQNMRDHLRGINLATFEISKGNYEGAAEIIDTHLGFGNLHGANGMHSARDLMPAGMQMLGHGMHTKAKDLSMTLRDAAITEDSQAIFAKMADLTSQCVACHDSYRLAPK